MPLRHLIYEVARPILGMATRNRTLIHWFFELRVPPHVDIQIDPATYLLKLALHQVITPKDRSALEVGIGQGSLLALNLLKTTALEVAGVGSSESHVHNAQEVARYNGLQAHFRVSHLRRIPADRSYDLVFLNPASVPARDAVKSQRQRPDDGDRVWDDEGGAARMLHEFLIRAPDFLSPRGRILFGLQGLADSDDAVEETIEQCGLILLNRITRCCIPSVVYIARPARRDAIWECATQHEECGMK